MYVKLSFKVSMQYKFDRFFILFAVIIRELGNVIPVILLLTRFISIKGWTVDELLLLYSFLFLSYSFFILFFTGIRDFEDLVYDGELDRLYLRPQGVLFQAIMGKVDIPAAIGYLIIGILLFVKSANALSIKFTPFSFLIIVFVLFVGMMIQFSIFLISASFSFRNVKVTSMRNLFFFSARRAAAYPLSFFAPGIQFVLTYLLPFAFINYFPTLYFLNKPVSIEKNVFLVFVPILLFAFSIWFWRVSIKKYSSTGTRE